MSFVEKAVTVLKNEGIILVPTDTHFAIAASPFCQSAMGKMGRLKVSLQEQAVTLCFSDAAKIWRWVDASHWQRAKVERCSQLFWPGALKITLPKKKDVLPLLDGGDHIALVCVKNRLLKEIIDAFDNPLAVIPATRAAEHERLVSFTLAREDVGDRVDLVVPSNSKNFCRQATTHISLLDDKVTVLRQGDLEINGFL